MKTQLLKDVIGCSINNLHVYYYQQADFRSLDWIVIHFDSEKSILFSTGKFADDIIVEDFQSEEYIRNKLVEHWGAENDIIIKKGRPNEIQEAITGRKILAVILFDDNNASYFTKVCFVFEGRICLSIFSGVDCLNFQIKMVETVRETIRGRHEVLGEVLW